MISDEVQLVAPRSVEAALRVVAAIHRRVATVRVVLALFSYPLVGERETFLRGNRSSRWLFVSLALGAT